MEQNLSFPLPNSLNIKNEQQDIQDTGKGEQMKIITTVIRWILSLLLLYGVYTETGKWTVLVLFLMFAALELHLVSLGLISKGLKDSEELKKLKIKVK